MSVYVFNRLSSSVFHRNALNLIALLFDLLRNVVPVVVNVDSCSDPAYDERNAAGYQIKPTQRERHGRVLDDQHS